MTSNENQKLKLALVHSSLPSIDEIDQFKLLAEKYDVSVVTSQSISEFLGENSRFKNLTVIGLPDHDENTTFLPGLEAVLEDFDVVIVKERLGLYAYQAVKAKWRSRFRLIVWIDNLTPFPAQDIDRMRTVRNEVTDAADGFIVQTEAAKTTLIIEGINEERIVKLDPWIDPVAIRGKGKGKDKAIALEKIGLSDGDFVVAHLGNLEWEDGIYDLVHGVKLAMDKDASLKRRLKIVFCSIGSFASQVRDRMVTLGIDRSSVYVSPSREATQAVLTAADCLYYSGIESLDRLDGDPYRLVLAMENGVPVLGSRGPIVEEFVGKHRIDFCSGSADSLAKAINKVVSSTSIVKDVIAKNQKEAKARFSTRRITKQMEQMVERFEKQTPTIELSAIDHQVLEVESKVATKQYLAAIDLIDSIFKLEEIPAHHKSNLYRLIGDSFTKLGDSDASKNAYLEAIELDPYSPKAFIGLGTAAMTKTNYSAAVIHFQKAITLAPRDEMANLGLGLAFQGLEEFDEAEKWVVNSLEINPENTAAIFSLVKVANERGEFSEASRALQIYITRHPHDHNMIFALAGIHYAEENFGAVIDLLNDIIAVDPMDSKAQSLIRQAKRAMEKTTEETSVG